jgi:hypothetical protein
MMIQLFYYGGRGILDVIEQLNRQYSLDLHPSSMVKVRNSVFMVELFLSVCLFLVARVSLFKFFLEDVYTTDSPKRMTTSLFVAKLLNNTNLDLVDMRDGTKLTEHRELWEIVEIITKRLEKQKTTSGLNSTQTPQELSQLTKAPAL